MLDFVVLGDDLARGAAKAGDRAAAAQECLRFLQIVPNLPGARRELTRLGCSGSRSIRAGAVQRATGTRGRRSRWWPVSPGWYPDALDAGSAASLVCRAHDIPIS